MNDIDDTYKTINEHNSNEKCKILIALDDVIAYMLRNKKPNLLVTKLFITSRKLNIFLLLLQNLILLYQNILDQTQHTVLLRKFQTKQLQQNAISHFSDINFKDL